jgi:hypothetical protein
MTRRIRMALRNGLPAVVVAAVAIVALLAVVVKINDEPRARVRGYAEFTGFPKGCAIEPSRSFNARNCIPLGHRTFRVAFFKSLAGSTPVVSRMPCCPGQAFAGVDTDNRGVIVTFRGGNLKRGIRAVVVVP